MVKSKDEEENKKPGLWERTKQILKPAALITATVTGFVFAGPVGAALAIGALAYGNHKLDERNAQKNADGDNSDDKKGEKEGTKPGFWKRALFVVGSIALGALIGGPAGIIAAAVLVIADTASKGELTKWSGDVLKAPITLAREGYSKIREAQGLSERNVVEVGKGVAGEELGRDGQKVDKSVSGFDNPNYTGGVEAKENSQQSSPDVSAASQKMTPVVDFDNPNYTGGEKKAKENSQQSSPDVSAASQKIPNEVRGQLVEAGAEFAKAAGKNSRQGNSSSDEKVTGNERGDGAVAAQMKRRENQENQGKSFER